MKPTRNHESDWLVTFFILSFSESSKNKVFINTELARVAA